LLFNTQYCWLWHNFTVRALLFNTKYCWLWHNFTVRALLFNTKYSYGGAAQQHTQNQLLL
jgi:hypothetical protein